MDSDLALVNGKSGRQSWRYADAFQRSIISEAIYHLKFTILHFHSQWSWSLKFAVLVTLVQRYVSTKLEVAIPLSYFFKNRRHKTDGRTKCNTQCGSLWRAALQVAEIPISSSIISQVIVANLDKSGCLGGAAQWLGCPTSDLAVMGSIPGPRVIGHLGRLSLPFLRGR